MSTGALDALVTDSGEVIHRGRIDSSMKLCSRSDIVLLPRGSSIEWHVKARRTRINFRTSEIPSVSSSFQGFCLAKVVPCQQGLADG